MKSRVVQLLLLMTMLVIGGQTVLADGGEPAPYPLCYPVACPR